MTISSQTISFLQKLKKNNNREWFGANRKLYESAKENFVLFVEALINELKKSDETLQHLQAKECIFRINRDIRFSKDKKPYKENMGAFISFEGRKTRYAGYYFHIEGNQCMVAGGVYMPQPEELTIIRQFLASHVQDFFSIIQHKKFKVYFNDLSFEESILLKKNPKGFEDADERILPYLKLKSFTVHTSIEKFADNPKLLHEVVSRLIAMQSFIFFLNTSLIR